VDPTTHQVMALPFDGGLVNFFKSLYLMTLCDMVSQTWHLYGCTWRHRSNKTNEFIYSNYMKDNLTTIKLLICGSKKIYPSVSQCINSIEIEIKSKKSHGTFIFFTRDVHTSTTFHGTINIYLYMYMWCCSFCKVPPNVLMTLCVHYKDIYNFDYNYVGVKHFE
jgi:hypothetical protein